MRLHVAMFSFLATSAIRLAQQHEQMKLHYFHVDLSNVLRCVRPHDKRNEQDKTTETSTSVYFITIANVARAQGY